MPLGRLTIFLLAIVLFGPAKATSEPYATLSIHVVDVGQGDAMILHQPGACTALIDAGGLLFGHRVTEKLQELGLSEIDLAIISHPHLDHFGGLFDLLPRIGIKELYDNGGANPVPDYFDDYLALRSGLQGKTLRRGDRLTCGDLELAVLHPEKPPQPQDDINGSSLVLLVTFGDFRLLHLGDLSGAAERIFLDRNDDLHADLLKIAHHGAADATSPELLSRSRPDLAIISCGPDNRIGAPAQQVLQRLQAANIPIRRTDQEGTISLTIR
ncbi:MAG: MBL fold metallo-hydrolase [Desulfofustis sp.]|jgi:competence protein ComEC|nr:MBL fold metallo-hydrolase [Desulfofustis sp.]